MRAHYCHLVVALYVQQFGSRPILRRDLQKTSAAPDRKWPIVALRFVSIKASKRIDAGAPNLQLTLRSKIFSINVIAGQVSNTVAKAIDMNYPAFDPVFDLLWT